jgi:Alanine-zipper, major outer membrane lipoprotein
MTSPTTARRNRLLALSIACALGLPLGVHAQSTTQSTKSTIKEQQLEKRVNQLEQELAELKAMIQEQKSSTTQAAQTAQAAQVTAEQANTTAQAAQTKVDAVPKPQFTTASGITVALHGFINASAFGQDQTFINYGNGQNAEIPAPPTAANKANGYTGALSGVDVRNTRFWLDFTGAKFTENWNGSGRLEMDFFGGDNGTGAYSQQQPIPRLRQAYMDITNPDWGSTIRIGQMWDLMFPLENTATSLSHIAFPLGYGEGVIGWRFPGAIWMQDLNHGTTGVKWRVDLGVFEGNWSGPQNEAGTANVNYLNAGAANFRPQVEARLHAQENNWLAYFAVHYSEVDLKGVGDIVEHPPIRDSLNSFGYDLGGQWKPGPWTFKGLIYSGKALGQIFGAMSQFGDINESGGFVQAGYNFTPKWSVWGFYSMVRPNNDQVVRWTTTSPIAGTAYLRDNQSALSLQYASGAYELSVEWLYDKLRYQVGSEGDRHNTEGNQVSLNGLYRF